MIKSPSLAFFAGLVLGCWGLFFFSLRHSAPPAAATVTNSEAGVWLTKDSDLQLWLKWQVSKGEFEVVTNEAAQGVNQTNKFELGPLWMSGEMAAKFEQWRKTNQ